MLYLFVCNNCFYGVVFLFFVCIVYGVVYKSVCEVSDSGKFLFRGVARVVRDDSVCCSWLPISIKINFVVCFLNGNV